MSCGGPLLICVDVCNDKGRNKSKDDDKGHKRQKTKIMMLACVISAHDYP